MSVHDPDADAEGREDRECEKGARQQMRGS